MVLIVLGGLFALVFLTEKTSTDFSKIHDRQKINSLNWVISLMSSGFDDSMIDVLKDCAGGLYSYYGSQSSCDYATDKLSSLLNEHLQGRKYYLSFDTIKIGVPCTGAREAKKMPVFVSSNQQAYLSLEICQ